MTVSHHRFVKQTYFAYLVQVRVQVLPSMWCVVASDVSTSITAWGRTSGDKDMHSEFIALEEGAILTFKLSEESEFLHVDCYKLDTCINKMTWTWHNGTSQTENYISVWEVFICIGWPTWTLPRLPSILSTSLKHPFYINEKQIWLF